MALRTAPQQMRLLARDFVDSSLVPLVQSAVRGGGGGGGGGEAPPPPRALLLRGPRGVGKSTTLQQLRDTLRADKEGDGYLVLCVNSLHSLFEGRLPIEKCKHPRWFSDDDPAVVDRMMSVAQQDPAFGNYDPAAVTPHDVENMNRPRKRHKHKVSRLNHLVAQPAQHEASDDRACARTELAGWDVPGYSLQLAKSIRENDLDAQAMDVLRSISMPAMPAVPATPATPDTLVQDGATLADAMDAAASGALPPAHATAVLLRALDAFAANAGRRRTVLLVDDVDALFRPVVYFNEQSRRLHGTSFKVGYALARALVEPLPLKTTTTKTTTTESSSSSLSSSLFSMAVVGAESGTPVTALRAVTQVATNQPRIVPVVWGTGELVYRGLHGSLAEFAVPRLSRGETASIAQGYRASTMHPDVFLDPARLRLMSGGIPRKLVGVCRNPDPI